jgi:hypothetical protein
VRQTPSVYAVFVEARSTYVRFTLQDSTDGGSTWSALDVSSSSLSVAFRAFKLPPTDGVAGYLVNSTLTKVTAASGIVGGYVRFTADYGQVQCEVVVIDSGTADANTTSGYREVVYRRWVAEVVPAVKASS